MLKFVIQFVIILLFFLSNCRAKKSWITPSNVLLGLYVLGAACSIVTLKTDDYSEPFSDKYWYPMLMFDLVLLLFLFPFRLFNESRTKIIRLPDMNFLKIMSTIIIVLSFFAIIYYSSSALHVMSLSDYNAARNAMVAGDESYIQAGLLNTIATVSSSFYIFSLLLFFIYSAIGGNKLRRKLLFLSSFSEPIHILSFVGRDGIVFWIITFVFLFFFFYPYISKNESKKIIRMQIYAIAFLMIPFFLISTSRFAESVLGTGGSIVSYIGQGFVNGPLLFGIKNLPLTEGSSFPLFFEITGIRPPESLGFMEIGDWKSWTFATFVGGFYRNFGMVGLYIVCSVMFFLFMIVMGKYKTVLTLDRIVLYILYFVIIGEGVFYFKQYTRGGNLFIIICLLFSLYLSLYKGSKSPIILERQ